MNKFSCLLFSIIGCFGGVAGWNIGEHFFHKSEVENSHISQQPKERHYGIIEAPVIVCDTIKAKVHYIINER